MELYLHSPYIFVTWPLPKHRDSLTLAFAYCVLCCRYIWGCIIIIIIRNNDADLCVVSTELVDYISSAHLEPESPYTRWK
jgi:hypothetical protein